MMKKRVLLPLARGFEEIEAVSVVDILRRADVEVVMASLDTLSVQGTHGIVLSADALLKDINPETFDMIVLPGGLPGATTLAEDPLVLSILQKFDAQKKKIAAICAAPLALKKAGVLKKSYTCYPSFEVRIDHEGYQKDSKVVCDAYITTSQGPSTSMLFALSLVEQLCGKERALGLRKDLLID